MEQDQNTLNGELAARFLSVQACYEMLNTRKNIRDITAERLDQGLSIEGEEGDEIITQRVKPSLFTQIMRNLDDRMGDIDAIVKSSVIHKELPVVEQPAKAETPASIRRKKREAASEVSSIDKDVEAEADAKLEEAVVEEEVLSRPKEKKIEPLLHAILLCATTELLCHTEIDSALVIDEYLNVTHGFYEKSQVSFVNGILDNIAKAVRE